MKIAIINITGGNISGGYRTYLKKVIPLLAEHPKVERLLCAAPESWHINEWFSDINNVEFINCSVSKLFGKKDLNLAKNLDRFTPDILFVPVERSFKYKDVPVVNMLQNMEPFVAFKTKNPSLYGLELLIKYFMGKQALACADRIIALSDFVRDFLINNLDFPFEKIDLIYHGFERDKSILSKRPKAIDENLSKKFIFTAGSIRPARGLEDIILASNHIKFNELDIGKIVIAGKPAPNMIKYKNSLHKLIEKNKLEHVFIFLDELNSSQMIWCYENCRAFIMSSRVESFGMIATEAMASGCLSIAAENPCLPEIFQDAAFYYKPKDAIGLANIINSISKLDKDKIDNMSKRAKARALKFSWRETANRLVRSFELTIDKNIK